MTQISDIYTEEMFGIIMGEVKKADTGIVQFCKEDEAESYKKKLMAEVRKSQGVENCYTVEKKGKLEVVGSLPVVKLTSGGYIPHIDELFDGPPELIYQDEWPDQMSVHYRREAIIFLSKETPIINNLDKWKDIVPVQWGKCKLTEHINYWTEDDKLDINYTFGFGEGANVLWVYQSNKVYSSQPEGF